MAKYWTYLRVVLTVVLILIPVSWALLWWVKKTKNFRFKTFSFLKDHYASQQIRKELEEKKESIINPKSDDADETNENFQKVIEEAIEEVSEDETLSEVATAGDTNREVVQSKKEKEELEEVSGAVSQVIAQEVLEPQPLDPKTQKLLDRIYVEANFLKNEGKFEDYEKKIIEGLAIDPTNLELTKMLTDLYFTLGSHKKALSLLKKIIERDPEDHKSLRQIGEIYFINGDNQTAELLVEKAINLKPDSPKYNLSLVEIYYNTDRINDAIACMEKIIKLRPANTNYLLTLAELYEETGDIANAKKYYFSILEFEPSNEKAKKKLKHYSE